MPRCRRCRSDIGGGRRGRTRPSRGDLRVTSQLFAYTGTMETFVVPRHQPGSLTVTVVGAGGASAYSQFSEMRGGGGGGFAAALNIAHGTMLYVIAGQAGESTAITSAPAGAGGGPYLGGQGGDGYGAGAAGGGAASEVRLSADISGRIAVGGGGGGGGTRNSNSGLTTQAGAGGIPSGRPGDAVAFEGQWQGSDSQLTGPNANHGAAGQGGTLTGPGAGGIRATSSTGTNGDPGSGGIGGRGGQGGPFSPPDGYSGGGGGGGYYGGGGGGGGQFNGGSGGGGSSYAHSSYLTVIGDTGVTFGTNGFVLFEWEPRPRGGRNLGLVRGRRG